MEWERELERREKLGIEVPDPIPHPDDIVIDMQTGTVHVNGPMTKEEKVAWDLVRDRRAACEAEIEMLQTMLDNPKCPNRKQVENDLEQQFRAREMIVEMIPK